MAGLFEELKRRNVVRVGIAYLVAAWLVPLRWTDIRHALDNKVFGIQVVAKINGCRSNSSISRRQRIRGVILERGVFSRNQPSV